jgi:hypothetical protein
MNEHQFNEHKRLAEILRLARMQLNEELMKEYTAAHTAWLSTSRTAWTSNGTLLPFTVQFHYPSEDEVVARGVELYKVLTQQVAKPLQETTTALTPETNLVPVEEPKTEKVEEPTAKIEDKFKSLITQWGGKGSY